MANEIVKRVAIAIGEKLKPALEGGKPVSLGEVSRAAIAAMREPTKEMREIMNAHANNGFVNWEDYHNAYIDAALKD